jgi:hypothetical protein
MIEPADTSRGSANPFAERVQIGARMERRMVKVLKVLHAFESKPPFNTEMLRRIQQLKEVYGMDYDASASHMFPEPAAPEHS